MTSNVTSMCSPPAQPVGSVYISGSWSGRDSTSRVQKSQFLFQNALCFCLTREVLPGDLRISAGTPITGTQTGNMSGDKSERKRRRVNRGG